MLPTFSFAIPKKAADVELLMVQAGVHSAREPRRMFTKAASATAACSVRTTAPLTTPPSADHQYLPLALPVFSGALDGSCRNLLYAGPACGGVLVLRWLWLQGGGGRRRRAAAGGRRWKVEVEGGRWKVEGGRWKVKGEGLYSLFSRPAIVTTLLAAPSSTSTARASKALAVAPDHP